MPAPGTVPDHVAVIMDGNRRWAIRKRLRPSAGHVAGVESVRRIIRLAVERQIPVLTLFAFSSENWKRPEAEVHFLMDLIARSLEQELIRLHRRQVRLRFIGDLTVFSPRMQALFQRAEDLTQSHTRLHLYVALNYGGQWDVVQAARSCAQAVQSGQLAVQAITPHVFQQFLSLGNGPPVDLLIRTSGEYRLSNFLLWELAYSELFFTPVLWPDFDATVLDSALDFFRSRERRYGGRPHGGSPTASPGIHPQHIPVWGRSQEVEDA